MNANNQSVEQANLIKASGLMMDIKHQLTDTFQHMRDYLVSIENDEEITYGVVMKTLYSWLEICPFNATNYSQAVSMPDNTRTSVFSIEDAIEVPSLNDGLLLILGSVAANDNVDNKTKWYVKNVTGRTLMDMFETILGYLNSVQPAEYKRSAPGVEEALCIAEATKMLTLVSGFVRGRQYFYTQKVSAHIEQYRNIVEILYGEFRRLPYVLDLANTETSRALVRSLFFTKVELAAYGSTSPEQSTLIDERQKQFMLDIESFYTSHCTKETSEQPGSMSTGHTEDDELSTKVKPGFKITNLYGGPINAASSENLARAAGLANHVKEITITTLGLIVATLENEDSCFDNLDDIEVILNQCEFYNRDDFSAVVECLSGASNVSAPDLPSTVFYELLKVNMLLMPACSVPIIATYATSSGQQAVINRIRHLDRVRLKLSMHDDAVQFLLECSAVNFDIAQVNAEHRVGAIEYILLQVRRMLMLFSGITQQDDHDIISEPRQRIYAQIIDLIHPYYSGPAAIRNEGNPHQTYAEYFFTPNAEAMLASVSYEYLRTLVSSELNKFRKGMKALVVKKVTEDETSASIMEAGSDETQLIAALKLAQINGASTSTVILLTECLLTNALQIQLLEATFDLVNVEADNQPAGFNYFLERSLKRKLLVNNSL